MQFECDTCGKVCKVSQLGPECSASAIQPDTPPKGWRAIYTQIEEHDGEGGLSRSVGEVLYSCADCNAQMSVGEHHEAEFEARKARMWQGDER